MKNVCEFSKTLLKQESALIWIMSIGFIILAFYCIHSGFTGSLPWLSAMVGFPWTAYGVSQTMYYRKSMKENTCGGIKYDTTLIELQQKTVSSTFDNTPYESGIDPFVTAETTYAASDNVDEYQI